jgi:hypothetical protein
MSYIFVNIGDGCMVVPDSPDMTVEESYHNRRRYQP